MERLAAALLRGGAFSRLHESANGITWTRLANQPGSGLSIANCPSRAGTTGLTACPIFRGALAVQPASGDLFALTPVGLALVAPVVARNARSGGRSP